ncbi:DUF4303 domain-containing protein [Rubripirellula reticaptiva]|uniref:DUF4303 domain-containing protein n=1 Tax=Rubripirellula reticaptiva TaxID=2528013 RepID=A0A5C6ESN8_9BACT|nr:DUF4303 domain-containing protein [Rubripirellula reticaptiva]TWU52018.1 hypothetical protein Poly59_36150 [Rubripirellula reticaptiva]
MSKAAYDNLNYSTLRESVASAASDIVAASMNALGDETIYGFAFCPDEDLQSMFWMANTEESLASSAAKLHKQAAKHGSDQTLEEITEILRFGCPEWAYGEESLDISVPFDSDLGLHEIWAAFRRLGLDGVDYDKGFAIVRAKCLDAIANGLRDYRKTASLKRDFVLLVQFPDSGDIPVLLKLAKQTNSPQTFRRLKAVYELE